MIQTKDQLNRVLNIEKKFYIMQSFTGRVEQILTADLKRKIWAFQKNLRLSEYHYNNRFNLFHKIAYVFRRRRKNVLGIKLGIYIWENSFDEGLHLYYTYGTVVNGTAKVGKNCKLHGNICIGNDGNIPGSPIIGDNVDIGVGARIIGEIKLGNNIKVGAGAVVIKDSPEDGGILVGVPARRKD